VPYVLVRSPISRPPDRRCSAAAVSLRGAGTTERRVGPGAAEQGQCVVAQVVTEAVGTEGQAGRRARGSDRHDDRGRVDDLRDPAGDHAAVVDLVSDDLIAAGRDGGGAGDVGAELDPQAAVRGDRQLAAVPGPNAAEAGRRTDTRGCL